MIRRLFAVLLLATLVSACSSTPDDANNVAADGSATAGAPLNQNDVVFDDNAAGSQTGSAAAGSQEDLVVNAGDRVFFGYDSSEVDMEGQATLQKQAAWLKPYPNVTITVEGHCDERGTREYNLALGERRAAATKNYLTALGVDGGRINTISYGKERPAVMGSNDAAWGRNRRGVTIVN
jgi:peptidoglycan-associated lipoprotein